MTAIELQRAVDEAEALAVEHGSAPSTTQPSETSKSSEYGCYCQSAVPLEALPASSKREREEPFISKQPSGSIILEPSEECDGSCLERTGSPCAEHQDNFLNMSPKKKRGSKVHGSTPTMLNLGCQSPASVPTSIVPSMQSREEPLIESYWKWPQDLPSSTTEAFNTLARSCSLITDLDPDLRLLCSGENLGLASHRQCSLPTMIKHWGLIKLMPNHSDGGLMDMTDTPFSSSMILIQAVGPAAIYSNFSIVGLIWSALRVAHYRQDGHLSSSLTTSTPTSGSVEEKIQPLQPRHSMQLYFEGSTSFFTSDETVVAKFLSLLKEVPGMTSCGITQTLFEELRKHLAWPNIIVSRAKLNHVISLQMSRAINHNINNPSVIYPRDENPYLNDAE